MMVSINEENYFSRVCIKVRSVELSLLAAVCKFSIPKSKNSKTFTPTINITIYKMKTMQSESPKKCSLVLTIPNTVVGQERVYNSFHVDIENKIFNNYFMRQRAYVEILSTREVWRARKRRKSCTRRSRVQLHPLELLV